LKALLNPQIRSAGPRVTAGIYVVLTTAAGTGRRRGQNHSLRQIASHLQHLLHMVGRSQYA
jgi:hypothetical protein